MLRAFEWFNEDVPALYVDPDARATLRSRAAGRPRATLKLTATRKTVPTSTVTAVLPGESRETIIFNTHTDGTGFVEENGAVALVHLARHFASREAAPAPADARVRGVARSLQHVATSTPPSA